MKKGQMEIIGFMVIILLLFFGLLLYFQLSNRGGPDLTGEAQQNLEVSHMLSALQLYTICDGVQLRDAVKACVQKGTVCQQDACSIVRETVPLLVSSFGWENSTYMFKIGDDLYSPGTCKGNTFVDDYTVAGTKVSLTYCYS